MFAEGEVVDAVVAAAAGAGAADTVLAVVGGDQLHLGDSHPSEKWSYGGWL